MAHWIAISFILGALTTLFLVSVKEAWSAIKSIFWYLEDRPCRVFIFFIGLISAYAAKIQNPWPVPLAAAFLFLIIATCAAND